jgi:hypothetical protein
MMYNIQNYWVSGLLSPPTILYFHSVHVSPKFVPAYFLLHLLGSAWCQVLIQRLANDCG